MVRRGKEDEIAGLSYANKQAALISVVERGEEQENEYEREAVISGNKGGKCAVWWADVEVLNADYECQTEMKHDNLNQEKFSRTSPSMGGARVECEKQSKKDKVGCIDF